MNIKNRGFSLFIAIVASLILMGVAVGIITSINRSLDQTNNIARSNQFFFAAESGKEAAFFHHNVRGAGLDMEANYDANPSNNHAINHSNIGANVEWSIKGRSDMTGGSGQTAILTGEVHENEKITIPLYWDSSSDPTENPDNPSTEVNSLKRSQLKLSFSDQDPFDSANNSAFNFGKNDNDVVLFVWSVSRINTTYGVQTFIPTTPTPGEPCDNGASFYCKSDFSGSGTQHFPPSGEISFNSGTTNGIILPGSNPTDLDTFMTDANSSKYEISFQPVLPFTNTGGYKISSIYYKLSTLASSTSVPKNIYAISSTVDFGNFKKTETESFKEKSSIGAFDYVIFK